METLWQDFKYSIRMLIKKPGFTAVAILTLALGIGANTAIFSVIDAVLLEPLPFHDPDRVVRIIMNRPPMPGEGGPSRIPSLTTDDFQDYRDQARMVSDVGLYSPQSLTLTDTDEPVRLDGARVSPGMFRLLGVSPILGRSFEASEETPGNDRVIILSALAWERYFGSDPNILNRTLTLDDDAYPVVGVMPASFEFPTTETAFWVPMSVRPAAQRQVGRIEIAGSTIARLAEGVSIEQATAEANTIFGRIHPTNPGSNGEDVRMPPGGMTRGGPPGGQGGPETAEGGPRRGGRIGRPSAGGEDIDIVDGPPDGGRGRMVTRGGPGPGGRGGTGSPMGRDPLANSTIELVPLGEDLVAPVRDALLVLVVAVAFVLLIACANVANLLLTRASGRGMEIAIRAALGAGRGRLVRQVLTESIVLAVTGGALGCLLAYWGVNVLKTIQPGTIPRIDEIGIDATVLAFTLGVSVITGLIFGLAPALKLTNIANVEALKEGGTSGSSGFSLFRRNRTRSLLAMAEVALAVVLLIGGGLLIHSFTNLANVNPGYDPENVLTFQISLPQARYPEPAGRQRFYEQMLERIETMGGVEAYGVVNNLPLSQNTIRMAFMITGEGDYSQRAAADVAIASPGYFEAMGISIVEGRGFTDQDRAGGPSVVLVNETFARQYFPNESAINREFQAGPSGPSRIVGVVADVRRQGLDSDPQPELYFGFFQAPRSFGGLPMNFTVRTAGEPTALVPAIRRAALDLDSSLTLDNVRTMEDRLYTSIAGPRFYAVLLAVFAGIALVLAAGGIYSVLSYSVSLRTREIGIRMALGAEKGSVLKMIVVQGMTLTVIGIVIGLGGALALTRYLESMLFGLTALDPTTFVATTAVLALTAFAACWVPGRRAMKVEPMIALRYE